MALSPRPEGIDAASRRPASPGLTPEDGELLDRVAARVIELHMELPALLTLETAAPLSVVGAQAMLFFEPFVAALLRLSDVRRFARMIERRECIAALADRIETRAEAVAAERRAAARARKAARAPRVHP